MAIDCGTKMSTNSGFAEDVITEPSSVHFPRATYSRPHLRRQRQHSISTNIHSLNEDGPIAPLRPPSKRRKIESWSFSANARRELSSTAFDYSKFRALLLEWVIADSVPFQKVESEHFRRLLAFVGSSVGLEDHMPSRTTLSRWVARAYDQQLEVVKEVVRSAATRVNLSFDLWTSQNQLALLGLVAHFIDHSGTPRTVLLSLPR